MADTASRRSTAEARRRTSVAIVVRVMFASGGLGSEDGVGWRVKVEGICLRFFEWDEAGLGERVRRIFRCEATVLVLPGSAMGG